MLDVIYPRTSDVSATPYLAAFHVMFVYSKEAKQVNLP